MKKLFTLALALVMLGAGCASNSPATNDTSAEPSFDPQDWYITFDDGQEWYAYTPYIRGDTTFGEGAERSTALRRNNTLVQNTNKAIQLPNLGYFEDTEYDDGTDWIMMDVTAYPSVATMPDDLDLVDSTAGLLGIRRGNAFDAWYFKTDERLYEIIPRKHEDGDADIDAIMKTIRER